MPGRDGGRPFPDGGRLGCRRGGTVAAVRDRGRRALPRGSGSQGSGSQGSGLLLLAVLLCAINLRAPVTSLPPVAGEVAAELGLTPGRVGLLTSVPVLCFALFTHPASGLLGRWGPRASGTVALLAIVAGTLVRSTGGFWLAVASTVFLGAGITLGNVTLPYVIARSFPASVALVTGLYTAAFNVGTTLTTSLTAPMADVIGWRLALASWSALIVAAVVVWHVAHAGTHDHGGEAHSDKDGGEARDVGAADVRLRDVAEARDVAETGDDDGSGEEAGAAPLSDAPRAGVTVLLSTAFAAQAFSFYGVTAWLPSILAEDAGLGADVAGAAAGLFQLFAIPGAMLVPLLLGRGLPIRAVVLVVSGCWLTLPVGLLLAPGAWPWWTSLAGVAQAGMFAIVFTLVAWRSRTAAAMRRVSAAVQTSGYAVAAIAPWLLGVVRDTAGSWSLPLLVVTGALLAMTVTATVVAQGEGRRA